MNWEDHVIKAGKKQKKNNDEISQRYSKLLSSIKVIDLIIKDYCDKFSNSGVHVQLEHPKKYEDGYYSPYITGDDGSNYLITVCIQAEKIYGRIWIEIEPHKFPYIVVTYDSHGREKISKYRGAIPENEVMKWIKYATRQASLLDHIRKMLNL